MGNQLTKLQDGKIIKKEKVTEQQLIEKLYKYERLGTIGKIKSKIENIEDIEQQMYLQFEFVSAKSDYLEEKLNYYKKENEELRKNINLSCKFREINEGLHEECKRYKKIIEDNKQDLEAFEILKNKLMICKSKNGDFYASIQDLSAKEITLLKKYRIKENLNKTGDSHG